MSLKEFKIKDTDISTKGVVAAPDALNGTATENKMVFDRLIREAVAVQFNALVDALTAASGASEIGAAVEGIDAGTVLGVLSALKVLHDTTVEKQETINTNVQQELNDRYTKEQTDNLLKDKADTTTTNQLVKSISFSAETGVFTITTQGGSVSTIDTLLERVPASFSLEGNQLVLTLEDGTRQTADLSAFIEDETNADEVKFTKDLITTYEIGSITLENGRAVIPAEGKTLQEVWDSIFVKELLPTVEEPRAIVTVPESGAYEVGTKVTPSYSAELYPGSYEYGPETGVYVFEWSVSMGSGMDFAMHVNKNSPTIEGVADEITVGDNTNYVVSATATHWKGAIPFTNLGNEYPDGQIAEGEKSATSAAITGYRNGFYGTAADKEAAIDSSFVRGLASKSGKTPAAGNVWNLAIPVGAMRIAFAYPATIRDVSSVLDVNGLNAEIKSAFTKYTVSVEGANGYEGIDYKVYVLDRALATTEANTFKITI